MRKAVAIQIMSLFWGLFLLLWMTPAAGQVQFGGTPAGVQYQLDFPQTEIRVIAPNEEMSARGEKLRGKEEPGIALHAGFVLPAGLSPATQGHWDIIEDSIHVWRAIIHSPGAIASGVNFSVFHLHEDARLFVYDPGRTTILGAFDHRNNTKSRKFSTAVVPGQYIVLEYQEPYFTGKENEPLHSHLEVESIIHLTNGGGIKDPATGKGIGDAGDCHVNINCPEGAQWQDAKRGIARMLMRVGDSYSWCTGSLVNNTAQDGTPYFLTAEHCGRGADNYDRLFWQFYFNFEHQDCPNQGFPPYHMVYGADLVAKGPLDGGSDFQLLVLQNPPPPSWKPYWNGWDRTNTGSMEGTGIHHPRGDVKKISTYNTGLVSATPTVSGKPMATSSAWRVNWTATESGHGVTEGGSSGSPIFNSDKKIIGTLTGGASSCDNTGGPDFYGKFWYHWSRNGTSITERLNLYLDPLETGAETLEGLDPFTEENPPPGFLTAGKQDQNLAKLSWYAPGNAPNLEGWYRHVSNFTHLSWAGAERATVFDAPALGLNYPVTLKKMAHSFVEHEDHLWPNDQFRFRIYDTNGLTMLYESELLTAAHLQEYIYELEDPLEFFDYFYVSVRPLHPSGYPSSLMKRVNYGGGTSFFGRAGSWNPHDLNDQEGSFAHLTAIYVSKYDKTHTEEKNFRLSNLHRKKGGDTKTGAQKSISLENTQSQPDSYRLFRNSEPIHDSPAEDEMTFLDHLPDEGFFRYQAKALYDQVESAPSNTAYLLMTSACEPVIDQWPYLETFETGFDDTCWLTHGFENNGWALTDAYSWSQGNIHPFAGNYFYIFSGNSSHEKDAWVILPEMDLSNLQTPAIRFWFNTLIEENHQQGFLALMVSQDNQSFEKIWDNRQHPAANEGNTSLNWLQTVINLKRFGGKDKVRFAFQYKGQQQGVFAIDHIEIINSAANLYKLNVEVKPEYSGVAKGYGAYIAGETVQLKATPNIAFEFEAWRDGTTFLSGDLEYRFIMPETNKTLTAKFRPFPDPGDTLAGDETEFKVFPNPASKHITIVFDQEMSTAWINLINIQGKTVYREFHEEIPKGAQKTISVGQLPKGVYLLQIKNNRSTKVIKIILTE